MLDHVRLNIRPPFRQVAGIDASGRESPKHATSDAVVGVVAKRLSEFAFLDFSVAYRQARSPRNSAFHLDEAARPTVAGLVLVFIVELAQLLKNFRPVVVRQLEHAAQFRREHRDVSRPDALSSPPLRGPSRTFRRRSLNLWIAVGIRTRKNVDSRRF